MMVGGVGKGIWMVKMVVKSCVIVCGCEVNR